MRCPVCEHIEDKVIDSRQNEDGSAIRRRRECLKCGTRYTTFEKIEDHPLFVVKKDGTREAFDRDKILRGIVRACEKRAITSAMMEEMVQKIESVPRNALRREISASEIGEMVMQELQKIDQVAYVRFASVYREFKDLESFLKELQNLVINKKNQN